MSKDDAGQHGSGQLLLLGVAQAAGFLVGALLGRWIGLALGWDALAPEGYTGRAMGGIALVGLGGGGGVQLARRWYRRKYGDPRV
ncbi:MAG: hypothetical protein JSR41_24580 [Proteobacteria bacterium]|nr:hypothetical protein [Pseudomonadota bacterium]